MMSRFCRTPLRNRDTGNWLEQGDIDDHNVEFITFSTLSHSKFSDLTYVGLSDEMEPDLLHLMTLKDRTKRRSRLRTN